MKLIVKIGTAVAGLYCLASCNLIHSNDMDCQHYTPDGIPFAYVGISLSTGKANQVTKADDDHQLPTGGEDGDGKGVNGIVWGAGIKSDIIDASAYALISALNRSNHMNK